METSRLNQPDEEKLESRGKSPTNRGKLVNEFPLKFRDFKRTSLEMARGSSLNWLIHMMRISRFSSSHTT